MVGNKAVTYIYHKVFFMQAPRSVMNQTTAVSLYMDSCVGLTPDTRDTAFVM